jgi:hypothetical protein
LRRPPASHTASGDFQNYRARVLVVAGGPRPHEKRSNLLTDERPSYAAAHIAGILSRAGATRGAPLRRTGTQGNAKLATLRSRRPTARISVDLLGMPTQMISATPPRSECMYPGTEARLDHALERLPSQSVDGPVRSGSDRVLRRQAWSTGVAVRGPAPRSSMEAGCTVLAAPQRRMCTNP